jgi:hypothetical protein
MRGWPALSGPIARSALSEADRADPAAPDDIAVAARRRGGDVEVHDERDPPSVLHTSGMMVGTSSRRFGLAHHAVDRDESQRAGLESPPTRESGICPTVTRRAVGSSCGVAHRDESQPAVSPTGAIGVVPSGGWRGRRPGCTGGVAHPTLSTRPSAALTLLRDTAGRPPPRPERWFSRGW